MIPGCHLNITSEAVLFEGQVNASVRWKGEGGGGAISENLRSEPDMDHYLFIIRFL